MDWQRCGKNHSLVEYYRGLIALRKQMPCLCDKSDKAGERVLASRTMANDVAAILMDNGRNSRYPELLMIFNASGEANKANLPRGKWAVLADGDSSLLWENPQVISDIAELPAGTALYLGRVKE